MFYLKSTYTKINNTSYDGITKGQTLTKKQVNFRKKKLLNKVEIIKFYLYLTIQQRYIFFMCVVSTFFLFLDFDLVEEKKLGQKILLIMLKNNRKI